MKVRLEAVHDMNGDYKILAGSPNASYTHVREKGATDVTEDFLKALIDIYSSTTDTVVARYNTETNCTSYYMINVRRLEPDEVTKMFALNNFTM